MVPGAGERKQIEGRESSLPSVSNVKRLRECEPAQFLNFSFTLPQVVPSTPTDGHDGLPRWQVK